MQYLIGGQDRNKRLDQFLAATSLKLSRSQIKRLVEQGFITVNNHSTKPAYRLKKDDRIDINIPPPKKTHLVGAAIPLNIIYEDKDIIVINKPRGIAVHPGAGIKSSTIVNALLNHCKDLSGIGGVERPGIVHRLDKDTSGVLVVAKNDKAHQSLSEQFKGHRVDKTYLAIVYGSPKKDQDTISSRIGRHPINRKKMSVISSASKLKSREAVTGYRILKRFKDLSLLELKPKTGRTHQIRVHLHSIGHPILGDPVYGKRYTVHGTRQQLLHAYKLKFTHPRTGKEMEFEAALPEDMLYYLNKNFSKTKEGFYYYYLPNGYWHAKYRPYNWFYTFYYKPWLYW